MNSKKEDKPSNETFKLYYLLLILLIILIPILGVIKDQFLAALSCDMVLVGIVVGLTLNSFYENMKLDKEKKRYSVFFLREINDTKPKLEKFHENPRFDLRIGSNHFTNIFSFKKEIVLFNTYNEKILLFDESTMANLFEYYANFIEIDECLIKFHELQKTGKLQPHIMGPAIVADQYIKEIDKIVMKNLELSLELEEQLKNN